MSKLIDKVNKVDEDKRGNADEWFTR
jgi:hypothetical protein